MSTPTLDPAATMSANPRSLCIRVVDIQDEHIKANISVPLGLVRVGLRMGARFAPELADLDVDEVLESIKQGTSGKIIDVTDEDRHERVEIYTE